MEKLLLRKTNHLGKRCDVKRWAKNSLVLGLAHGREDLKVRLERGVPSRCKA